MKVVYTYSHLGGEEILSVRKPEVLSDIQAVIGEVKARRLKISNEKTKKGRELFSPKDMNRQFREAFRKRDFAELVDRYVLTIPDWNVRIAGAYKQVDFVRDRVLTEVLCRFQLPTGRGRLRFSGRGFRSCRRPANSIRVLFWRSFARAG